MAKEVKDIRERTFEFAVRIVKLCQNLDRKAGVPRTLSNQLLKAGTSVARMSKRLKVAKAGPISLARMQLP